MATFHIKITGQGIIAYDHDSRQVVQDILNRKAKSPENKDAGVLLPTKYWREYAEKVFQKKRENQKTDDHIKIARWKNGDSFEDIQPLKKVDNDNKKGLSWTDITRFLLEQFSEDLRDTSWLKIQDACREKHYFKVSEIKEGDEKGQSEDSSINPDNEFDCSWVAEGTESPRLKVTAYQYGGESTIGNAAILLSTFNNENQRGKQEQALELEFTVKESIFDNYSHNFGYILDCISTTIVNIGHIFTSFFKSGTTLIKSVLVPVAIILVAAALAFVPWGGAYWLNGPTRQAVQEFTKMSDECMSDSNGTGGDKDAGTNDSKNTYYKSEYYITAEYISQYDNPDTNNDNNTDNTQNQEKVDDAHCLIKNMPDNVRAGLLNDRQWAIREVGIPYGHGVVLNGIRYSWCITARNGADGKIEMVELVTWEKVENFEGRASQN